MDNKKLPVDLSGIKNIIWAISILVCLFALAVGLIYDAVNSYGGEHDYPVVQLASREKKEKLGDNSSSSGPSAGTLNELPKSKKAGEEYIGSLTFVCDSACSPVSLFGGNPDQVWIGESGVLNSGTLSSAKIIFPGDGSSVSIANAAMVSQPGVLVMMLGADGITLATEDAFKTEYATVIGSVLSSSPDTQIICCSVCPNTAAYAGADAMAPGIADTVNDWIREVCARCPVWYADLSQVLTDGGYLKAEFGADNGKSLNADGVQAVLDYLNTHSPG